MLQEVTGRWYSAEYWSFAIDDEANKYRIHGDGYSGDAGDVLHVSGYTGYDYYVQDGMGFTTYDEDNDNWPDGNCAVAKECGFWHNYCYWWCLTRDPSRYYNWGYSGSADITVSASRMMIKLQQ